MAVESAHRCRQKGFVASNVDARRFAHLVCQVLSISDPTSNPDSIGFDLRFLKTDADIAGSGGIAAAADN